MKKEKLDTEDELVGSSRNDANSDVSDNSNEEMKGNLGWADSIARILNSNKPKYKKSTVLSRAKKLNQIKQEEKPYDFEIENEIKVQANGEKHTTESNYNKQKIHKTKIKFRVKPSLTDREREKALKKIATKGVVQLFNAVRIQQKDLNKKLDEAGPLDHRKDAVLNNINKRKFLDVLMSGERAKSEFIDNPIKEEIKEESESNDEEQQQGNKKQWNVLRDDFMTNKKLKHWDQDDSDSENIKSDNFSSDEE